MPDDDKTIDDNKPEDKKAEDDLTPAQTKQALRYILQEIKSQGGLMTKLEERLDAHATPPKGDDKSDTTTDDNEVDVDALDNRGLLKHMTGEISKLLEPIQKQLSHSDTKIEQTRASSEVEKAASSYNDFYDFKGEIEERIKANPNLSVDDAYHLAKVHNPEKVIALQEAAQKIEDDKKEEDKKEEKSAFGGLLPTSTIGEPNQRMEAKEAANNAWDETMAGFDSIISH